MIKNLYTAIAVLLQLYVPSVLNAQRPVISYSNYITGLTAPIDLVNAGDGSNRLFIAEQGGLIKLWEGGLLKDFLNMGSGGENLIVSGGEQGLLSMVFHPDYGSGSDYFFVYYTDLGGNLALRRYETVPGPGGTDPSVLPNTATDFLVMTINHPTNNNHNGGKLNFGTDGYLYFATGDGGGGNDVPNNAQNGNSLLGKMLRIDIDLETPQTDGFYGIPADNPYVGDAAVRDEIWALGLRNPFRWSFDRANGNMWIGDVGQGAREEINFRAAGSTGHVNYGWRCYEGHISTPSVADCTPADNVYPVFDYNNPNPGSSAVTGGYVYRGPEYASLYGTYIAADVYSDSVYLLWPNGSGGFDSLSQLILPSPDPWFIVGFGEAEDGTLYAVSQGTGAILKVVATGGTPLPVTLTGFSAQHFNGYNELKWKTVTEQNTARFIIEFSTNRNSFTRAGEVVASRNENGSDYSFRHYTSLSSTIFYRLAIQDDDGSLKYSSILRIPGAVEGLKIFPTVINDGIVNVSLGGKANRIQLLSVDGANVFEKELNQLSGSFSINLPSLPNGLYVIRIMTDSGIKTEKLIVR
jgi:glucose/arabinose dehydrogenase